MHNKYKRTSVTETYIHTQHTDTLHTLVQNDYRIKPNIMLRWNTQSTDTYMHTIVTLTAGVLQTHTSVILE